MKIHEFYQKYASMPLSKRTEHFGYCKYPNETKTKYPQELYERVKELDKKIRPFQLEIDKCLDFAEKVI